MGTIISHKTDADSDIPATISERLKAQAYGLGFDVAGIAQLGVPDSAPQFDAWLAAGNAGNMTYLHDAGADLRRDANEVTAPAAVDRNFRQGQDAFLDIHRHHLARAKRRGAPYQVTTVAVGHLGLAGLNRLGADLTRQVFG